MDSSLENIDYQTPRGLDKSLMLKLSDCQWVNSHNILIVGPTGTGKTFLACAFAHKSCLLNYSANYYLAALGRLIRPRSLRATGGSKTISRMITFIQTYHSLVCFQATHNLKKLQPA